MSNRRRLELEAALKRAMPAAREVQRTWWTSTWQLQLASSLYLLPSESHCHGKCDLNRVLVAVASCYAIYEGMDINYFFPVLASCAYYDQLE